MGTTDPALRAAQHSFVLEWGRMSGRWGINPTMAQIHALLFITGEQLTMEEIMERASISRGNASMNLRDLIDWGVVRRFRFPGERRDTYSAETDALTMIVRVVRERKRRELDPTVETLQSCIHMVNADSSEGAAYRKRIADLLEVFEFVNMAFRFALDSEERAREVFEHRDQIKALLGSFARSANDFP